MLQALHQPKALRQAASRPREHHHNGQDSSGSKGFGSHSQHGGRWEVRSWTCHAEGSIKHRMAAHHFSMGCHRSVKSWQLSARAMLALLQMAHLCLSFHSTPSEAATIWSAALAKRQCLGQRSGPVYLL